MKTRILGTRFRKYLERSDGGWEYDLAPVARSGMVDSAELLEEINKHLAVRNEAPGVDLARSIEPIVDVLRLGSVPIAAQVQKALDHAAALTDGKSIRCDSVAPRSWSTLGPPLAAKLAGLASGAREATGADLRRVAKTVEAELGELVTKGDLAKGRFAKSAVEARILTGSRVSKASTLFTDDEIEALYADVLDRYTNWTGNECGCNRGRTCRHFRDLNDRLHILMGMRKAARGEPMCGRR